jgi:hypothetical protein
VAEASGVAVSRRLPGHVWVHNDSGEPVLTALDAKGAVVGRVQVTGVKIEDWEALAVGPCPAGSCIYVADIGDNDASRDRIAIHRVPEPPKPAGSVQVAETVHATYPDGAHDAETLLVAPDGGMFIVTKGDTGPVALYRFPKDVTPGRAAQLERIGQPRSAKERLTDGAISPDGTWVVLRSNESAMFYRAADFLSGQWREVQRVDLTPLREPQGEGIAFGSDNVLYLVGEGGGKGQSGTFARFMCTPAP